MCCIVFGPKLGTGTNGAVANVEWLLVVIIHPSDENTLGDEEYKNEIRG